MPSYSISLNGVKAESIQQAEQIKNDLIAISAVLTPQNLHELALLLKSNPGIVDKAKQFRHLF